MSNSDAVRHLPFDPGALPVLASPAAGEFLDLSVSGFPPIKRVRESLRNPRGRLYDRFLRLRREAETQMSGRAWYFGPVKLDFTLMAPRLEDGIGLIDYIGGIQDTLDGSHGPSFTFLPVVFQDDCQVCDARCRIERAVDVSYKLRVEFL